ncbi:hypothetical protein G7046_g1080 [Stylonectria norvegica]|nr:hypothetical protein G7046_g1080 [Stylonectria norvegica]
MKNKGKTVLGVKIGLWPSAWAPAGSELRLHTAMPSNVAGERRYLTRKHQQYVPAVRRIDSETSRALTRWSAALLLVRLRRVFIVGVDGVGVVDATRGVVHGAQSQRGALRGDVGDVAELREESCDARECKDWSTWSRRWELELEDWGVGAAAGAVWLVLDPRMRVRVAVHSDARVVSWTLEPLKLWPVLL